MSVFCGLQVWLLSRCGPHPLQGENPGSLVYNKVRSPPPPDTSRQTPPLSGSRGLSYNPRRHARRCSRPRSASTRGTFALPRRRDTLRGPCPPTPAPTCGGPSALPLPLPRRTPRRLHAGRAPPPARTLRPGYSPEPRWLPGPRGRKLSCGDSRPCSRPRAQTDVHRGQSEAGAGSGGGASVRGPSGGRRGVESSETQLLCSLPRLGPAPGAPLDTPGLWAHPGRSTCSDPAPSPELCTEACELGGLMG